MCNQNKPFEQRNMSQYKILIFSLIDSYKHGNILEKLLKLRYQGFIVEEKYDVPSYNDLEFDQYDNPFAKYIVITKNDEAIACSRINRTDIPYMAKDCWSHLIPKQVLPNDANFYEWTRQYVSSKLSTVERVKMVRIISTATYFALIESSASGACYVTHSALYNATKRLGMNIQSVAKIDLPSFPNLHFVHVDVNVADAKAVAKNLLEVTGFDILPHFTTLL
jgi:N-acyl-L-homoserine lactone synthetase